MKLKILEREGNFGATMCLTRRWKMIRRIKKLVLFYFGNNFLEGVEICGKKLKNYNTKFVSFEPS